MGDLNIKFYMININESNMVFFKKYLRNKKVKHSYYTSPKNNKRYVVISLNDNEVIEEKYINKENCERLFRSPEEYIEYIELLSESKDFNIFISEEYHTYLMSKKNKVKDLVALFFDSKNNITKYVIIRKDLSNVKDVCKYFNIQTKEEIENEDIKYWLFENKRNTSFMLCRKSNEKAISLRANDLRFFNYLLNFEDIIEGNNEKEENIFVKSEWKAEALKKDKEIAEFIFQNNPIGKRIKSIKAIGTTSYSVLNENINGLIEYKLTNYEPFVLSFYDGSTLEILVNKEEKLLSINSIDKNIYDGESLNNFDYNIFLKSFINKEIKEVKVLSSSLTRTRYKLGKTKVNSSEYKDRNNVYIVFTTKDNQALVIKSGNGMNYEVYISNKNTDLPLVKIDKELLIESIKEIPIEIFDNKDKEKIFGIRKINNNESIKEFIEQDDDLFFSMNKKGYRLIEYFLKKYFNKDIQSPNYEEEYNEDLTTLYNNECINNIIKDLDNIIYKIINDIKGEDVDNYKNSAQWFYSKDGETVKFLIDFSNKLKEINKENIILYVY